MVNRSVSRASSPNFPRFSLKVQAMTTAQQSRQNLQVAQTILEHLGGNRFRVMTGAHILTAIENGLKFKLGKFPGVRINAVRIVLNGSDLYDLEFSRIWGNKIESIKKIEDVYAEDLQRVFTDETGLDTHL